MNPTRRPAPSRNPAEPPPATRPCRRWILLILTACTAAFPPAARAQGTDFLLLAGGSQNLSIIQFTPAQSNRVETLRQDLRILARVLERHLGRTEPDRSAAFRMGIPMLLSTPAPSVHTAYLEGFGALLTLDVDFPLVPSAGAPQTGTDPRPESDWDAARREIEGQPMPADPSHVHDPARLDQLRLRLLATLRQATNLVHLADSDSVAIVVRGPGPRTTAGTPGAMSGMPSQAGTHASGASVAGSGFSSSGGFSVSVSTSSDSGGAPDTAFHPPPFHGAHVGAGHAVSVGDTISVLTIRARRTDLDALRAGSLTPDTFARRVDGHAYTVSSSDPNPNPVSATWRRY